MNIHKLIKDWKLNQSILARKMGMPAGTFKVKLSVNQHKYKFSEAELNRLRGVMHELASDIINGPIGAGHMLFTADHEGNIKYESIDPSKVYK